MGVRFPVVKLFFGTMLHAIKLSSFSKAGPAVKKELAVATAQQVHGHEDVAVIKERAPQP
jgi:hypothetical protein